MIQSIFHGISIQGITCCVPDHEDPIDSYRKEFGTENVDKFVAMTGAATKYITLPGQTAADLSYVAAKRLLVERNIDPQNIGALVFVSETPDYRIPASAFVLQKQLGLGKNCICFDINLGCSGYVNGLNVLCSLMQSSNIQHGLLLVGDTMSKTVSPQDRSVCMLIGDAASATLLSKDADAPEIRMSFMCDGGKYQSVMIPAGGFRKPEGDRERTEREDGNWRSEFDFYMDGANVFIFSTSDVPKFVNEYLGKNGNTPNDYDGLILHQANELILKRFAKKVKFSLEKVPMSISRYGNTVGASIPITIADAYGNMNGGELSLLVCGFGVGMSWGLADIKVKKEHIFPVIISNETMMDQIVL